MTTVNDVQVSSIKKLVSNHWNYYLLIEEDFRELFKYVEPCRGNQNVYGPAIAKLLLTCGSEIDVVLKELFEWTDPVLYWEKQRKGSRFPKRLNISSYMNFIKDERAWSFREVEVRLRAGELHVFPWNSWWWKKPESPKWWTAYNNVKHNRAAKYDQATLKNAFHSLAALFICVTDLARTLDVNVLKPMPKLLSFANEEYGSASIAEFRESTLTIDAEPAFRIKSDVIMGLITEQQQKEKISLGCCLHNMTAEERIGSLNNLSDSKNAAGEEPNVLSGRNLM